MYDINLVHKTYCMDLTVIAGPSQQAVSRWDSYYSAYVED